MLVSSIIKCGLKEPKLFTTKKIIRNYASKTKNLYDILGLTPHATQADIKAAYYKLSKAYHPDLNPKDVVASEKFRAISEAYEVLGTYRLRKMYDRGIIHTAGSEFSHHAKTEQRTQPYDLHDEVNDDETTKFYKSRLRREHTGKSKIYDFDEWTRNHYGDTFRKQQAMKNRNEARTRRETNVASLKITNHTLLFLMSLGFCFVVVAEYLTTKITNDVDRLGANKEKK